VLKLFVIIFSKLNFSFNYTFIQEGETTMKKRIILACLALGLINTLNADSFFNTENNEQYKKFHQELSKFFNDDNLFKIPYEQYKMNFINAYPKMNVFENEKDYTFKFELAGFDKKDIIVTISDQNLLTIKGQTKKFSKEEKKNLIKQEHHFGEFSRSVSLPEDINAKKIQVSYDNGILQVVIQKDSTKHKEKIRTLQID